MILTNDIRLTAIF